MASTKNAFELLLGGDQPAKAGGGKKKNKKKKQQAGAEAEEALQPSRPVPVVVEDEQEDDQDFQPVPQHHVAKTRPAAPEAKASTGAAAPAKAGDACAALEKEATAASGSGRAALAAKWTEQVRQAATGPKYAEGGKQLDFKQVLAKSRALDRLVDSLLAGCAPADEAPLAALLAAAAHPTVPAGLPQSLAAAVVRLGRLAASDPLSAGGGQAARGVAPALALLKAGLPAQAQPAAAAAGEAAGTAGRLSVLASKLLALEAQLPKTTSLKEQVKLWSDIFLTTQSKLDVLGDAAAGPAQAPEVQAVLQPLQSLHGTLEGRIKEVQGAKSGATVEAQLARAQAAFKEEDAALQARLGEVEERAKALEAELAGLRQEAAQLRDRRSWAAEHQQQLLAKIKSGAADSAAVEADLEASLQAVDGLSAALLGAAESRAPGLDAQALAAQLVAKEVPGKFIGAVQQVVDLGLKVLHEMAGKAQFYRDRLAQATRQAEHMALLKLADAKQREEHKKQTDNLQKMLQEVLASAEAAAKSCQDTVAAYSRRVALLLTLPNFPPPPPEFSAHLEALAHQASQLLGSIVAAPAPAPAAAQQRAPRSLSPEKQRAAGAQPAAPGAPAAAPRTAAPAAAAAASSSLAALEQRLEQLEQLNRQKDAQIAALLSAATVEVPSPVPAMLSSPPPAAAALPGLALPPAPFAPGPADAPSLFTQPPVTPLGPAAVLSAAPADQVLGQQPIVASPAVPAPAPGPPPSFAQALAAGRGRGGASAPNSARG